MSRGTSRRYLRPVGRRTEDERVTPVEASQDEAVINVPVVSARKSSKKSVERPFLPGHVFIRPKVWEAARIRLSQDGTTWEVEANDTFPEGATLPLWAAYTL